jgi:ABC-2 type transport system permease protein
MNKYWAIGKINFINSFVYVGDQLASAAFIAIIIFIFGQLWSVIISEGGVVSGFTFGMLIWYLVMTEAITTSFNQVIKSISNEITSGAIANYLNKPYHYYLYKYSSTIGGALFKFILTFLFAGAAALIITSEFSFSFVALPLVFIVVFLAITLHFAMMFLLGVLAFWLEEARALNLIYQKIVFTLGGMLVPLEVYPLWFQRIGESLPFSYVAYYPAKLFVQFSLEDFFNILAVQGMWLLIIGVSGAFLFTRGMRKVSINGG